MLHLNFNLAALMDGLKITGFCMGGIFVVMLLIFLSIFLLEKIGNRFSGDR